MHRPDAAEKMVLCQSCVSKVFENVSKGFGRSRIEGREILQRCILEGSTSESCIMEGSTSESCILDGSTPMGCVLEGPTLQCICEPQAVREHFLLLFVVRLFMMIVFIC